MCFVFVIALVFWGICGFACFGYFGLVCWFYWFVVVAALFCLLSWYNVGLVVGGLCSLLPLLCLCWLRL